jgi:peptidoglycan hydrolase CwlO-like protein
MKKIIAILVIAFAAVACGGKQTPAEQPLTSEQETEFVDEVTEELNTRVTDITTEVDSLNNAVDSLLQTIN